VRSAGAQAGRVACAPHRQALCITLKHINSQVYSCCCASTLLMQSASSACACAHVHTGTAGGEAQQSDIRQLLRELELKKAKLNELKGESRRLDGCIARARDDNTDAQRLTPGPCAEEHNYIQVSSCRHLQQRCIVLCGVAK
jgi:hypothetical protein